MNTLETYIPKAVAEWEASLQYTAPTIELYSSHARTLARVWTVLEDLSPVKAHLKELANSTARVRFFTWKKFLEHCPREWHAAYNANIMEPAERRKVIRFLDAKQAVRVLTTNSSDDVRMLLLYFGMKMGLRLAEIMQLKFEDFDSPFEWVRVMRKGNHEDMVPVAMQARQILKRYSEKGTKTGPLFPFTRRWAQKIVEEIGVKATLPFKLTPHCLRHTCATLLHKNGIDPFTIKQHLGHSNLETTMKYVHVTPMDQVKALKKIERLPIK